MITINDDIERHAGRFMAAITVARWQAIGCLQRCLDPVTRDEFDRFQSLLDCAEIEIGLFVSNRKHATAKAAAETLQEAAQTLTVLFESLDGTKDGKRLEFNAKMVADNIELIACAMSSMELFAKK
ncbi:MAG: hypothetical protein ACPGOY_13910 [Rhodospirillaceae bacterium]